METRKLSNSLNKSDPEIQKFATKKWYIIDSQTTGTYNENNTIKFYTKVIKSNLCDYSETYILVTGNIENKPNNSGVCFKNCAPFVACTSQINDEFLEDAKNLDITMPMHNLLEYSDNYEDSTGSLYHFKRSEITTGNDANANITAKNSTPFTFRASLVGNNVNNVQLAVPLKYLSNFSRSLEMPLINCKIHLELTWVSSCLLCSNNTGNANVNVTFEITDTKLYVPIATLSTKDTNYLTTQLSEGFKRSVYWNEYTTKREPHNADDVDFTRIKLDLSFQGVNRLFVLAFNSTDGNNLVQRESYRTYYLPRVDLTKYNVLIGGRNFYDQPINSQIRKHDELRKVALGKGDDYTTGCLLDYAYFKKNY